MALRRVSTTVAGRGAAVRRSVGHACLAGGALATLLGLFGWGCGEGFTSGGQGGAGGATTTTPSTGGTTTSSPTVGGGGTGTAGGGMGGTGAAGAQGGASQCAHDECSPGVALVEDCSACVLQVCDQHPPCCADTWTAACVLRAVLLCGKPCSSACEAAFGNTAGFELCNQGAGTCEFMTTENDSCVNICGARGMSCNAAATTSGGCAGPTGELNCGDSSPEPKLCTCYVQ